MREKIVYEIMHGDKKTAQIDTQGKCRIYCRDFLCTLDFSPKQRCLTLTDSVNDISFTFFVYYIVYRSLLFIYLLLLQGKKSLKEYCCHLEAMQITYTMSRLTQPVLYRQKEIYYASFLLTIFL